MNAHEKIGTDRTEGCSGLVIGSLGLCPIVRGIGHIIMRDSQVADGCFALKWRVTQTIDTHHAVEHRYENVQDENNIGDKISEHS